MKTILQEYGTALLAALTAGMIFLLWLSELPSSHGGRGIYQILAESVEQAPKEYSNDFDRVQYKEYMTRSNPVISCNASAIHAGEEINWQNIFPAIDAEAHAIAVRIVSVNGMVDIAEDYRFSKGGIYEVEVLAVDAKQKQTRKIFRLPVLPHKNK